MPEQAKCPQCGAAVDQAAITCKYCGEPLPQQRMAPPTPQYAQPQPQVVYVQHPDNSQRQLNPIDPSWPVKSKVAAGLLAIFLGGLGIHKFYLGKTGAGVLYLLFFWTYVPAIIGFIEGIIYLCSSDHDFQVKNRVRIG